jgi:hypothetical protein
LALRICMLAATALTSVESRPQGLQSLTYSHCQQMKCVQSLTVMTK